MSGLCTSRDKIVPVVGSDDKREITAVLATGEYWPPNFYLKAQLKDAILLFRFLLDGTYGILAIIGQMRTQ